MKLINHSIRTDDSEMAMWRVAAAKAGENVTEFIRNSINLRIQNGQLNVKPKNLAQLMSDLMVIPYEPTSVSPKEAAEVEKLLQKDRRGELEYIETGKARVKPPVRRRQSAVAQEVPRVEELHRAVSAVRARQLSTAHAVEEKHGRRKHVAKVA